MGRLPEYWFGLSMPSGMPRPECGSNIVHADEESPEVEERICCLSVFQLSTPATSPL